MKKYFILLFYLSLYFLFILGIKYIPKERQIYFKQKYIFNYNFQHSLKLDMIHRDKASFHYLLTHEEELEKSGGIEAQLSLAIYEDEYAFMYIIFNEYHVNIEKLLKENPDVARQLLREKHIDFFKKLIFSLNKNKQKEICKEILKIEIAEFLKHPKSEHTFFKNPKVFSSFLQLSKIPKDDILLVSLLTHASGLFKVNLVRTLIDYGVVVNKTDEKNVTPLLGLFIYTPTVDKMTTLENNSFDADFVEANMLLTWYLQKYKGSTQRKEEVFTQEQERVFRLNIKKKREIYYMLIKAGADDNSTKVNNQTVYNFLKKYKG